jgi:hypothetical protein
MIPRLGSDPPGLGSLPPLLPMGAPVHVPRPRFLGGEGARPVVAIRPLKASSGGPS